MKHTITTKDKPNEPDKPDDCASSCKNVSQCEDGCIGYENNAEEISNLPDEPYVDGDAAQHYNREKDMGVGRW